MMNRPMAVPSTVIVIVTMYEPMICRGARKMYSYAVSVKSFGRRPKPSFMIVDSLENDADTIRMNGSRQNTVKIAIAVYEMLRITQSLRSSLMRVTRSAFTTEALALRDAFAMGAATAASEISEESIVGVRPPNDPVRRDDDDESENGLVEADGGRRREVVLRHDHAIHRGLDDVGGLEQSGVVAHEVPEEAEVAVHDAAEREQ